MQIIFLLKFINLTIAFALSFLTEYPTGDFPADTGITFHSKVIAYFVVVLCLVVSYMLANSTIGPKPNIPPYVVERFSYLLFFIVIANIAGLLFFNIGAAGQVSSLSFAFVFNLINVDTTFLVFYCLHLGTQRGRFFWLIFCSYLVLKVAQGWTGILYDVFLFEIYHRYLLGQRIKLVAFGYLGALVSGAFLYQLFFPLKMLIRTGVWEGIPYLEAFQMLISRLSSYNNLSYIVERQDYLASYMRVYLQDYSAVSDALRRILPTFLFPNKDFDNTNRLVILLTKGDTYFGSVDVNFYGNMFFFFTKSFMEGLLYILVAVALTTLVVLLSNRVTGNGKKLFIFSSTQLFLNSGSFGVSYAMTIFGLLVSYLLIYWVLRRPPGLSPTEHLRKNQNQ